MIRRSLSAMILVLLAVPALGASPPWTAAGTTAIIDESSVSLYALTPPFLGFSAAPSTGVISAYFNVTDTSATSFPTWNTLEISAFDNHPQSQVSATLFRLDKCNGAVTALCTAISSDNTAVTCSRCTINTQLDFTLYDYYITVSIYRSLSSLTPRLYGVRLYNF